MSPVMRVSKQSSEPSTQFLEVLGHRYWSLLLAAPDSCTAVSMSFRKSGVVIPSILRQPLLSENVTVTFMAIGTAAPFTRVGVNRHWRTASIAA